MENDSIQAVGEVLDSEYREKLREEVFEILDDMYFRNRKRYVNITGVNAYRITRERIEECNRRIDIKNTKFKDTKDFIERVSYNGYPLSLGKYIQINDCVYIKDKSIESAMALMYSRPRRTFFVAGFMFKIITNMDKNVFKICNDNIRIEVTDKDVFLTYLKKNFKKTKNRDLFLRNFNATWRGYANNNMNTTSLRLRKLFDRLERTVLKVFKTEHNQTYEELERTIISVFKNDVMRIGIDNKFDVVNPNCNSFLDIYGLENNIAHPFYWGVEFGLPYPYLITDAWYIRIIRGVYTKDDRKILVAIFNNDKLMFIIDVNWLSNISLELNFYVPKTQGCGVEFKMRA